MKIPGLCSVFLLLTILTFSCKSAKIDTQGLRGQVYWLEGNQMPQMVDEGKEVERSEKKGVARTLRIHELTHINQARLGDYLFGDIETPLVAEVETDDHGRFSVELPVGKYSVFTVEESGYFANIFDLDSYINPIEVEKGEWTHADILVNYEAAY